ncbi:2-amino-4-hydroxy-6-hydroxymethyldihydropteridine diphosphokinase [Blattabacterium cuenoti]|uniref:2-amino-4-hydroxy-6- hydroxymethyldihydropteridine diphosphokinase n=1 Tax=Blattabacterium cuenoti TaxID=1653831 RepID=UPI00163BC82B|nr:2-amino-4-hydroxy-6-hydroxymethyldihydropteridine diphosphokinase [Blattabacterium cuenoti]
MKKKHYVFLMQGSNNGDRKKYLEDSFILIQKNIGNIIQKSSYFESEAWNMKKNTPLFYNRVLHVETIYSPIFILKTIFSIEKMIGKETHIQSMKKTVYKNRKIDIDILLYDSIIMNSNLLTIPHPMLHLRKFVLLPMSNIIPEKIHPILNKSIVEILGLCSDSLIVKKINI